MLRFGCKVIIKHEKFKGGKSAYEESVIIVKARSSKEALAKALEISKANCNGNMTVCGALPPYHILGYLSEDGLEAFSSFKFSNLPAREFMMKRYFTRNNVYVDHPVRMEDGSVSVTDGVILP